MFTVNEQLTITNTVNEQTFLTNHCLPFQELSM